MAKLATTSMTLFWLAFILGIVPFVMVFQSYYKWSTHTNYWVAQCIYLSGTVYTRRQKSTKLAQRCGLVRMTLASAYVLHCLSAMWFQLQRIKWSLRWRWVLIWCVAVMTFKLGSGCNLGKDLSRNKRWSQLVKYRDTRVYLQLYI